MSDPQVKEKTVSARGEQIRARVTQLRHSRQYGMFGVPEIVGLAASGVMLLAVIFSYFYFLTPARANQKAIENERTRLQNKVRLAQEGIDPNASPQTTVDEINQSLERFESEALMQSTLGRRELYNQLNDLMKRHNLRNTAGPVYSSLDPLSAVAAATASSKAGNARWQTPYPGIGIAVTVEGPYANLRRFLREIETNNQFIIVNAVELEGVTETDSPTGASLVSLHLDMSTYFQRESGAMDITPTTETR